jgi:methionyl-tRNA synthetase
MIRVDHLGSGSRGQKGTGSLIPDPPQHWFELFYILGKDILKFHAIYWPAFLSALGLELPRKILVSLYHRVLPHSFPRRDGR